MSEASFHDIGGMKIGTVPVELLVQRRQNYQRMGTKEMAALRKSVDQYGFKSFIAVQKVQRPDGTFEYEVIDGHHRWAVAKEKGMEQIPVILLEQGMDGAYADLAMIAMNVKAEVLPDVMLQYLTEIAQEIDVSEIGGLTAMEGASIAGMLAVAAGEAVPLVEPLTSGEKRKKAAAESGVIDAKPKKKGTPTMIVLTFPASDDELFSLVREMHKDEADLASSIRVALRNYVVNADE